MTQVSEAEAAEPAKHRREIYMSPEHWAKLQRIAEARGLSTPRWGGNASAAMCALIDDESARLDARPTLYARAKTAPDATRELMFAALVVSAGSAAGARQMLDVSERDWRSAVDHLEMSHDIAARWPQRRG